MLKHRKHHVMEGPNDSEREEGRTKQHVTRSNDATPPIDHGIDDASYTCRE